MGWNIAIHFNKSKKQANILKREIERYGVECICIQGNLLNAKIIKKIITTANKKCDTQILKLASCMVVMIHVIGNNFLRNEFLI